MQMEITAPPTEGYVKLNVRPADHARFKVLAAMYGVTMETLFSRMVTALEADAAERKPESK